MEICPAQLHISIELLFNAGWFASVTVGDPGIQGDGVTGMHGIGVSTPMAAAVAAATIGLAGDWHIPNGMMLTIGMWSWMLAAGMLDVFCMLMGNTTRLLGAMPMVH
jgi:hypothetical protein